MTSVVITRHVRVRRERRGRVRGEGEEREGRGVKWRCKEGIE